MDHSITSHLIYKSLFFLPLLPCEIVLLDFQETLPDTSYFIESQSHLSSLFFEDGSCFGEIVVVYCREHVMHTVIIKPSIYYI